MFGLKEFTKTTLLFLVAAKGLSAQDAESIQTLDTYVIQGNTVANETPLPTYSNPVSLLSFSPQVDVQSRGFAEAQGDVSIRGGTFENTGVSIDGLAIFDPQTGHYLMELPIDPRMLQAPRILTGFQNQLESFNANVGSVYYQWSPVSVQGGQFTLSFGENHLNTQSLYLSLLPFNNQERTAIDIGIAHSESNGTIAYGDHSFKRYAARLQHHTDTAHFHLTAGYQDKFFGWPNMYTPYNVQETEDIQTLLIVAGLDAELTANSDFKLSAYFRDNRDDYEFDRDRPGLYNPYQHQTQVGGLHSSWTVSKTDKQYGVVADLYLDSIDSTTLTNSFQSRTYSQFKVFGSWLDIAKAFDLNLAISVFDTNRNSSTVNPSASLIWKPELTNSSNSHEFHFDYSRGTQVSGYTAIGSAPRGLFAGNSSLDVEKSDNFELAYHWQSETATLKVATFYRLDRDLTDWTFSYDSQSARTANAVDIDTFGVEILGHKKWNHIELAAGYTYLQKDEDYQNAQVDASFYALNYPDHRFTLSWIQQLHSKLELRLDSEYRVQQENALRNSGDTALLAYVSVVLRPVQDLNWELCLSVENLLDSDFEEIPAVPASRRQFAIQSMFEW